MRLVQRRVYRIMSSEGTDDIELIVKGNERQIKRKKSNIVNDNGLYCIIMYGTTIHKYVHNYITS